jgi:hypothetical protein
MMAGCRAILLLSVALLIVVLPSAGAAQADQQGPASAIRPLTGAVLS